MKVLRKELWKTRFVCQESEDVTKQSPAHITVVTGCLSVNINVDLATVFCFKLTLLIQFRYIGKVQKDL